MTIILIYWYQCPRCYMQIKNYYLAIGWRLLLIFSWHIWHSQNWAKDQLFYKNSIKRSVLKSQFHNPQNLEEKNWFFTIHAKTTLNSRRKKNIKYTFTRTAKGRSLEVPTKRTLFYLEHFFSTQPQCYLTFTWTKLQILTGVDETLLILTFCLELELFISCLCDLFFIFIIILTIINLIISWIQTHLFFIDILEFVLLFLDDNVDREYW